MTVDGRGAGEVVADVQARVDKLLEALPPDFNEPLLTRESLSEAQVPSNNRRQVTALHDFQNHHTHKWYNGTR